MKDILCVVGFEIEVLLPAVPICWIKLLEKFKVVDDVQGAEVKRARAIG